MLNSIRLEREVTIAGEKAAVYPRAAAVQIAVNFMARATNINELCDHTYSGYDGRWQHLGDILQFEVQS